MACFHPLKAVKYKKRFNPDTGKNIVRILRKDEYDKNLIDDEYNEFIEVPCGQCAGCRMDYARDWANRLFLELQNYDEHECFFVTLTYNDLWLYTPYWHIGKEKPMNNPKLDTYRIRFRDGKAEKWRDREMPNASEPPHVLSPIPNEYGEPTNRYSFSTSVRDMQLFMKRLRKLFPNDNLRFYGVSEYGEKSLRPHYHFIIFGLHLDEGFLNVYGKSGLGYDYMRSNELYIAWPYGNNIVAPVTWESCCYVARYMMKKQKGEAKSVYSTFGLEEPRSTCSRRPGISNFYYEDHGLDPERTLLVFGTDDGSKQFPAPRYLEKLFELEHPEESEKRRERRKLSALNSKNLVVSKTSVPYDRYMEDLERKFLKRTKVLSEFRQYI